MKVANFNNFFSLFNSNGLRANNVCSYTPKIETQLHDFINFKLKTKLPKFLFEKSGPSTKTIKLLNWFEYCEAGLTFYVCKALDIATNESLYFMTRHYNYKLFTEQDIQKSQYLQDLQKLKPSLLYDVEFIKLKDFRKLNVRHFKSFSSFDQFLVDGMQFGNVEEISDFYIAKTHFRLSPELSSCHNTYKDFHFTCLLNGKKDENEFYTPLNPSGFYNIETDSLLFDKEKNVYYIKDLADFLKDECFPNVQIPLRTFVFDIESQIEKGRKIDSEKNILTHIGFEYFNSLSDNKSDKPNESDNKSNKSNIPSFKQCLINFELHLVSEMKKMFSLDQLQAYCRNGVLSTDALYNAICQNNVKVEGYPEFLKKIKDEIVSNTKAVYLNLPKNVAFPKVISYILEKQYTYIYLSELNVIEYLLEIMNYLDFDYVLTYNGNGYDFPQLARRQCFLKEERIDKILKIPTNFGIKPVRFFQSSNAKTNFSQENLQIDAPFIAIDMLNYIKKFQPSEASYSLKNICLKYFSASFRVKGSIRTKELTFYPQEPDLEKKKIFDDVFKTSNYCYINDNAFKITEKSEKYFKAVSISETLNTKHFWDSDDLISVSLSKDDVEIATDVYFKQNCYEIADYCLHDAILCRHLFTYFNVLLKIGPLSTYYLLPQNETFSYRNSTNINGQLLRTSLSEKGFLLKGEKLESGGYSGGKVLDPQDRFITEPTLCFDIESMYPSIMIQYNISPDCLDLVLNLKSETEYIIAKDLLTTNFRNDYTIVTKFNPEEKIYLILLFSKTRKGILNSMLKIFKKERLFYKARMAEYKEKDNQQQVSNADLMQYVIKILMNSIYGFLGSEFSILACSFSSQAVTATGAKTIEFLSTYLDQAKIVNNQLIPVNSHIYNPIIDENMETQSFDLKSPGSPGLLPKILLKVVYGDTDSIMVKLENFNTNLENQPSDRKEYILESRVLCTEIGEMLGTFINQELLKGFLKIAFEAIFFDFILLAKKKYRALKVLPNSSKIEEINKGISLKRRDNCAFQKEMVKEFYTELYDIMNSNRFSEKKIQIEDEMLTSFLIRKTLDLILQYKQDSLEISNFVITNYYKRNYVNQENPIISLVQAYNEVSKEKIVEGERFSFIFVEPKAIKQQEIPDIPSPITVETFKDILKALNWNKVCSGVNDKKIIFDAQTNLDEMNLRLSFETYMNKLITDILTIFQSKHFDDIYKPERFWKKFLY